jgi:tripartite-type tricarboxylate transporter receptor subunit TctC
MNGTIRSLAGWLTSAVLAYHGAAIAQDRPAGYPARPVRVMVSVAPGAGADAMARAAAQMLTYSGAAGVGSTVHLGMERFAQRSIAW